MAFLFYLHVTLVGFSIAAAAYHFAALIGAPRPQPLPVAGSQAGPAVVVPLWLFAGPVALLRNNFVAYLQGRFRAPRFVGVAFAFLWAFCLGILALELVFRLTHMA
jgi:hypothetical protein